MTEATATRAIADALSTFDDDSIGVAELQSRLGAIGATLDSSHRGLLDELRDVDNGLERVIFGVRIEKQREAAREVVTRLRAMVKPSSDA